MYTILINYENNGYLYKSDWQIYDKMEVAFLFDI